MMSEVTMVGYHKRSDRKLYLVSSGLPSALVFHRNFSTGNRVEHWYKHLTRASRKRAAKVIDALVKEGTWIRKKDEFGWWISPVFNPNA